MGVGLPSRTWLLLGVAPCLAASKKSATTSSKCDFPRIEGRGLSTEDFRRRFRGTPPGQPVVLTGLSLGPGLKKGKGGSGWDPAVLASRFGNTDVESQDVVVYGADQSGGLRRSGLGATTKLGSILEAPGATLFLLKPHHPATLALGKGLQIPGAVHPIQLTGPTLSVGGVNASSPFHEHPENWFGQIRGRKGWVVRPSGLSAEPSELRGVHPCLFFAGKKLPKGVQQCVLKEGEVLYLPPQWTHGTCNLDSLTVGIGYIGQLDHLPELHLAVALGDATRTRELSTPATLASRDHEGKQPLHWAAQRGHSAILKLLLSLRADVTAADAHGALPVHLGAFEGYPAVVRTLIKTLPSVASARTQAGAQPLHLAASRGHASVASLLLSKRAAAGARDAKGAEPLHMAAYEGHLAVTDVLLAHGASARAKSDDGTEPAHLAKKRGHGLLVARLLGRDASEL